MSGDYHLFFSGDMGGVDGQEEAEDHCWEGV
jgi:hypothetical protein